MGYLNLNHLPKQQILSLFSIPIALNESVLTVFFMLSLKINHHGYYCRNYITSPGTYPISSQASLMEQSTCWRQHESFPRSATAALKGLSGNREFCH